MLYCFKKGKITTETQNNLCTVYGEGTVTDWMCQKSFEKFRVGYFLLDGVPWSGLPDSIIMSSLVDKVIIVSSNKMTPKSEFMSTKNALEKANAPIAGFIVNKIDSGTGVYGKYYYYYGDRKW